MRFLLILSLVFSNNLSASTTQTLKQIQTGVYVLMGATLATQGTVWAFQRTTCRVCVIPGTMSSPFIPNPGCYPTWDQEIPYPPTTGLPPSPNPRYVECKAKFALCQVKYCKVGNELVLTQKILAAVATALGFARGFINETETTPNSSLEPPPAPDPVYNEVVCTTLTPDAAVKECICLQTGWTWENEACVEPTTEPGEEERLKQSSFAASETAKSELAKAAALTNSTNKAGAYGSSSTPKDSSGLKSSLNYLNSVKDKISGLVKDQNASLNKTEYNSAFSNVMSESKGFRSANTVSKNDEKLKPSDDLFENISSRYSSYQAGLISIQK